MSSLIVSEARVHIRRSPEDVFQFVSTPENDPSWVRASASIRRLSDTPIGVGSILVERVKAFGVAVSYTWEVTAFQPNRLIAYTSRRGILPMTIEIFVAPQDGFSEVGQRLGFHLPRLLNLAPAITRAVGLREARLNLANLKECLESKRRDSETMPPNPSLERTRA